MRMLMRWRLGVREASDAIRSGRMAEINERLDELTKPEAQYFCTEGGDAHRLRLLRPGRPVRHPPDRRATVPRAQRDRRVLSGNERRSAWGRTREGVGRF